MQGIKLGRGTKKEVLRNVTRSREGLQRWRMCEVLIVDEVSMISGELFDKIEYVARAVRQCEKPFGGIQVILCGDFFQLPPVFDADEHEHRFCFEADCWCAVVPQSFMLRQIFRQRDTDFIEVLSEVRTGAISPKTLACLQACIRAPWKPCEGSEPTRLCLLFLLLLLHFPSLRHAHVHLTIPLTPPPLQYHIGQLWMRSMRDGWRCWGRRRRRTRRWTLCRRRCTRRCSRR